MLHVGGIDGHADAAHGQDGEINQRPLRAVFGEDAHAVAGLHAQGQQAAGDGANGVAHLAVGDRPPAVIALDAHGDFIGIGVGALEGQSGEVLLAHGVAPENRMV